MPSLLSVPPGHNQGHPTANEIGCQCWQPVVLIVREAIFDRDVLAFDIASFFQTPMERGKKVRVVIGRPTAEEPDHRHRRLLRPCRERPRRRAAEQRDERAAPHIEHGVLPSPRVRWCP